MLLKIKSHIIFSGTSAITDYIDITRSLKDFLMERGLFNRGTAEQFIVDMVTASVYFDEDVSDDKLDDVFRKYFPEEMAEVEQKMNSEL